MIHWRAALLDLFVALDKEQLALFAAAFGSLASAAAERGARIGADAKRARDAEAKIAALDGIGRELADEIAGGAPRVLALQKIAARHGVPVETVEHYGRRFARSRHAEAMTARRLAVVRLALAGKRNDEIAAALGLSRRTVERALQGINWSKMAPATSPGAQYGGPGSENRPSAVSR